jgi:DNA adenine methylase
VSESQFAKPFPLVKWVGGKRQLQVPILRKIDEVFDRENSTYYEPFFGGGAILFALEPRQSYISDINSGLVNLYNQVKDHPDKVKFELKRFETEYNKLAPVEQLSYFLNVRAEFNAKVDSLFVNRQGVKGAASFLFLNKTGFNGMYRENAAGEFNIPFGKRSSVSLFDDSNIESVSNLLSSVDIKEQPYNETVASAQPGDLVYFDPPYAPLTKTSSFEGYNSSNLGGFDQSALRDLVDDLTSKKVFCLVSNSSAQIIEELYKEYSMEPLKASRAISASAQGRKAVKEYLIDNFSQVQR